MPKWASVTGDDESECDWSQSSVWLVWLITIHRSRLTDQDIEKFLYCAQHENVFVAVESARTHVHDAHVVEIVLAEIATR